MSNIVPFSEERLPLDLSLAAIGGAEFSTNVLTTISGFEQRNINWQNARARYRLKPECQNSDQLEKLIHFFRVHKGRAIGFRLRDWADYAAIDQVIGQGDGVTRTFQLKKTYQVNEYKDERMITKPVEGTLKIYLDEQEVACTCDYSNGQVTFNFPPSANTQIKASFEFDVPVRFDSDHLELNSEAFTPTNIPIIELKVTL
jgi:uncharacterized protein (TIGR02217 family)